MRGGADRHAVHVDGIAPDLPGQGLAEPEDGILGAHSSRLIHDQLVSILFISESFPFCPLTFSEMEVK